MVAVLTELYIVYSIMCVCCVSVLPESYNLLMSFTLECL